MKRRGIIWILAAAALAVFAAGCSDMVEELKVQEGQNESARRLKNGVAINGILRKWDTATKFAKSQTNNEGAADFLDIGNKVPVWLDGTTIYYYSGDYGLKLDADSFYFFRSMTNLESIELSDFDTSNVVSMGNMFNGCSALTSLDLSKFDTSSVTNMEHMFNNCSSLTSLDLGGFDTSSVTKMNNMFVGCSTLTSLDVSSFDTSSVTDMSQMFYKCFALTSLDLGSFNTSSVTDMFQMFYKRPALTSLNLSGFDTSSVTNMGHMFAECPALTTLDLSGFNTSSVTFMPYMFYKCTALATIYAASGADWSNGNSALTDSSNMFSYCTSLPGYGPLISNDISNAKVGVGGYFTDVANKP